MSKKPSVLIRAVNVTEPNISSDVAKRGKHMLRVAGRKGTREKKKEGLFCCGVPRPAAAGPENE